MTEVKKVFGIISYFPNKDTSYHIETRRERSRRCRELLFKLEELWPTVDIMIIAQNWQDFELPQIKNKILRYDYEKLGILGARKELRTQFLASEYDYLIMLDDDFIIEASDPEAYMQAIDSHPNGFGALKRYPPSPLPFFAISKSIYRQIDLPDIDPEKGEGFEDDIFAASCFAKFPEAGFIFPEGSVLDKSFHYDGPGKCPSSWSREHNYNWDYMRTHTKDIIRAMEYTSTSAEEFSAVNVKADIDLVIPYVNSSDNLWFRDYAIATKSHNPTPTRFRSWGTLKYLLRGVAKYMPFIRQVVLIVARPSQVPVWINQSEVRIVYHDEFIPKQHLPTFNSCTIESYLWNIKDLGERIIYFNDDMFPNAPMLETDFFTGDVPHNKFIEREQYNPKQIFRSQVRSSLDLITRSLGIPDYPSNCILRPYHISSAIRKNSLVKVGELCEEAIGKTVTKLRVRTNVNQYIYLYYQYFTHDYVDEIVDYMYYELTEKNMDNIVDAITAAKYKMLCLNDSENIKDYTKLRIRLHNVFAVKFPDKCKYEI